MIFLWFLCKRQGISCSSKFPNWCGDMCLEAALALMDRAVEEPAPKFGVNRLQSGF